MSKQKNPQMNDLGGKPKGSKPPFTNTSANSAVPYRDLSKSFRNLKVNDKKKTKRNSFTDSEASDSASARRGVGGGVVTTRATTSNHHAQALQEIRRGLVQEEINVRKKYVQNLAREYNTDETTAENAMKNSPTLEAARDKLILILRKKMDDEAKMHSNYYPQSQFEYRMPYHPDFPYSNDRYRGSPDGASHRADSPGPITTNGLPSKITHSYNMRQMLLPNHQHPSTPEQMDDHQKQLIHSYLHPMERGNLDASSVSATINPGHVQEIVQKMTPAHVQSGMVAGENKRNSYHQPVIKGTPTTSNMYHPSMGREIPNMGQEISYGPGSMPSHLPPSYVMAQTYRNQKQTGDYDTPSDIIQDSAKCNILENQTKRSSMRMSPLPQESNWIDPINGALSGNINLPMYQSSSSVHSSSPRSSISSGYKQPNPYPFEAELCHVSFSTVSNAKILRPVSSQPVSKPQPMTAEVPPNYRDFIPQHFDGRQPQFAADQSYPYQMRDPPPYIESSSATSSSVRTNGGSDQTTGSSGVQGDVERSLKNSSHRPRVADNYLSAVESSASNNSNTNNANSNNAWTGQVPPTRKPTNNHAKGTESAIRAARVTATNSKRHSASSYSAVSAAKQQKAGSISGSTNVSRHPPAETLPKPTDIGEEKTIRTSPVPMRKNVKNDKMSEKSTRQSGHSSDSEEETSVNQRKLQSKRVKMFSSEAYKFFMEQHIENVIKGCRSRASRRMQLEQEMHKMNLPREDQEQMRTMLYQKESNYIRLKRGKINLSMFHMVKPLGVGAFGKVFLACKTSSGALYAIKVLKKKDVLKRNQVAHVKAERDILSEADNDWVVRLYYTFQDKNFLYFVMDYIPGGDMMSLLIKKGIFEEPLAMFYTAELTAALESVHKMGFIHRDIKPDNILIDRDGHIKLTDFGLCTGFRWTHDSKYYQRGHAKQDSMDMSQEGSKYGSCALKTLDRRRIRDANRYIARSLVGTPNYIAPEVLLREGYTQLCDWWSVGVILYEMVVGQPPFNANTPEETQFKVINWQQSLRFPENPQLESATKDLIFRLCTDQKYRLGCKGVEEIKQHAYFKYVDWPNLRRVQAPHIPKILYAEDTSNFDPPESDFMLNQSQAGTLNSNTLLKAGEHAFLEFTFRRFFDEDGRAYSSRQYSGFEERVCEESSEEECDASDRSSSEYMGYMGDPHGHIGRDEYV